MEVPQISMVTDESIETAFPFDSFRKYQKKAIRKVLDAFSSGKSFVILDAPTGSGKSPMAVAIARIAGQAHFITIQKMLQDQYHRDFSEMAVIKGRGNYQCMRGAENCASGLCITRKLQRCAACPYWHAIGAANLSNFTVHNFDSFYYQRKHFSPRELLVVDEAHNIEQKFMGFVSFTINNRDFLIDLPDVIKTTDYIPILEKYMLQLIRVIEKIEADELVDGGSTRILMLYTDLIARIERFLKSVEEGVEFIHEREEKPGFTTVKFKPVMIDTFTPTIFGYGRKVLLMSATIIDPEQFCASVGVEREWAKYIGMPSTFPVKNRPLVVTKELDLRYKVMQQEMPKIPRVVQRYLDQYPEEKGVIHTHTNKLLGYIRQQIRSPRFLFKEDFENVNALLDEHGRKPGSVIVAAGFHEGLDLKDDLARFQVILKVPYPDLSDKQIKRRMELDKRYYSYLTSLKLIQSYGRGVRSQEDWCDCYIVDVNFQKFFWMYKGRLPKWFLSAIQWP